jgi:tetratricopeptide (TPR) repeat protein
MRIAILLFFVSINFVFAQNDDYNFRNAHQNMVSGNYQAAIKYYDLYLQQNTNSAIGYQERGICYMNLADYQKANDNFSRAIIIMPMNSDYYINRGYSYMFLELPQNALDDFTRAINLGATNNPSAYIGKANANLDMGNPGLALTDINAAISLAPQDSRALVVRAEIYALMNDTARMFQDFYTISNKYPDAIYADVKIYTLSLIYDNANADILYINDLLTKEPNNFFLYMKQGFDYYILKKFSDAKTCFQLALDNYSSKSPIASDVLKKFISNCNNYMNK